MAKLMMEPIGLGGVLKNLEEFNLRTQRRVKVAVKESADYAAEVARQECPVSPDGSHGNPSGTLRKGIEVRVAGTGPGSIAGTAEETAYGKSMFGGNFNVGIPGGAVMEVYDPVFYAAFVELGTKYMKAHPFMYPGFVSGKAMLYKKIAEISLL